MAAPAVEVHHRVPRCLLAFFDRASSGELDGAGLQAWFEWEEEAFRYGVDPDVSRGELAALIEGSAVEIPEERHKASHCAAGDFVRWGRLGDLETLRRYGPPWFALLGRGAGSASVPGRSTTTGQSVQRRRGGLTAAPLFLLFAYILSLYRLRYAVE